MRIFRNLCVATTAMCLLLSCQIKHGGKPENAEKEQKEVSAPTLATKQCIFEKRDKQESDKHNRFLGKLVRTMPG